MTTSFKKTLIAASVGAVLAAGSFAAIAGTPGTTNLLFPFITTENGAFTFISISNQNQTTVGPNNLHFTYATKGASAANSVACAHLDGDATATANDLMQFEITNKVPLTGFGGTSVPKFFPSGAAPQRGMLIVNNETGSLYGGGTYNSGLLYGEARIINTSSGLAAGYSTDDLHTTSTTNPDFTLAAGPDGGSNGNTKVISWFPDPTVTTTFYMLPLGTEQTMAFAGNVTATYQAQNSAASQTALGVGGHYNNKEGFQSSTATAAVTCLGTFSRADLLGTLNAPFSANGGWANFRPTTLAASTAPVRLVQRPGLEQDRS
jgi:hypothetical protein